jgi:hypothetical protein
LVCDVAGGFDLGVQAEMRIESAARQHLNTKMAVAVGRPAPYVLPLSGGTPPYAAVHGDYRGVVTAEDPGVRGEAIHMYVSGWNLRDVDMAAPMTADIIWQGKLPYVRSAFPFYQRMAVAGIAENAHGGGFTQLTLRLPELAPYDEISFGQKGIRFTYRSRDGSARELRMGFNAPFR